MAEEDRIKTRSPTPEEKYKPTSWFFDGRTGYPNLSTQQGKQSDQRFVITKIEQKPRFKSRHNTLTYQDSEAVTRHHLLTNQSSFFMDDKLEVTS